jgi:hypothetical protein
VLVRLSILLRVEVKMELLILVFAHRFLLVKVYFLVKNVRRAWAAWCGKTVIVSDLYFANCLLVREILFFRETKRRDLNQLLLSESF